MSQGRFACSQFMGPSILGEVRYLHGISVNYEINGGGWGDYYIPLFLYGPFHDLLFCIFVFFFFFLYIMLSQVHHIRERIKEMYTLGMSKRDKTHKHLSDNSTCKWTCSLIYTFLPFYTSLFTHSLMSATAHPRKGQNTFFHSNWERASGSTLNSVTDDMTYITVRRSTPPNCESKHAHTRTHH